jgi:hypothetical protein
VCLHRLLPTVHPDWITLQASELSVVLATGSRPVPPKSSKQSCLGDNQYLRNLLKTVREIWLFPREKWDEGPVPIPDYTVLHNLLHKTFLHKHFCFIFWDLPIFVGSPYSQLVTADHLNRPYSPPHPNSLSIVFLKGFLGASSTPLSSCPVNWLFWHFFYFLNICLQLYHYKVVFSSLITTVPSTFLLSFILHLPNLCCLSPKQWYLIHRALS